MHHFGVVAYSICSHNPWLIKALNNNLLSFNAFDGQSRLVFFIDGVNYHV